MSEFFKMPDQEATIANNKKKTSIWVERYRPDSLENYVGSPEFKAKFQSFIDEQDIQHLLFYGGAGTGKCLAYSEMIDIEIDVSKDEEIILKPYEI